MSERGKGQPGRQRYFFTCSSGNGDKDRRISTEIKEATKFDNVELFLVDLASYASVNAFCEKVEKEVPRLDILVENAALAHREFIPTPDGWEHQYVFQIDYNNGGG